MTAAIAVDRDAVADFCCRNHVRRLALFGSVLRSDIQPDSDIDVLVEFEPSEILGRKVDLRTPAELSRYFRQQVLDSSKVLFVDE